MPLRELVSSHKQKAAVYEVRFLCCGAVGTMTRDVMARRHRVESQSCRKCQRAAAVRRGKNVSKDVPYGVTPPQWPVPPSLKEVS